MWHHRNTWWHHNDGHMVTSWQPGAGQDCFDAQWSASWQSDTRWQNVNSHWRMRYPEIFEDAVALVTDLHAQGVDTVRLGRFFNSTCARHVVWSIVRKDAWSDFTDLRGTVEEDAAGLVTDLLAQSVDPARLGQFLRSTCARDVVWSFVGEDSSDAFTVPRASVEDGIDDVTRVLYPTSAAYERGTEQSYLAPSQSVVRAGALVASPAGICFGGDESGGLGLSESTTMATSSSAVDPPPALGSTYQKAGRAVQSNVRKCLNCPTLFSCRKPFEKFCCSVCRNTRGRGHSSGEPTCKRAILDAESNFDG